MVQEGARPEAAEDQVAVARDVDAAEGLHGRRRLAFARSKAGEVVAADQRLRCHMHPLGIELDGHMPDAAALQGRRAAAGEDAVKERRPVQEKRAWKSWGTSRASSTEIGCGRRWKLSAPTSRSGSQSRPRSRWATWPNAWTPASGAAGSEDGDGFAGAGHDSGLDGALDGRKVGLALPTLERAAVILEQETVARHGLSRDGAQGERETALQFLRGHRPPAGALNLRDLKHIAAAGDGKRHGDESTRHAAASDHPPREEAQPLATGLAPAARGWVERAELALDKLCGLGKIEPAFLARELAGVGDAGLGLGSGRTARPMRCLRPSLGSSRRPAPPARSCSSGRGRRWGSIGTERIA